MKKKKLKNDVIVLLSAVLAAVLIWIGYILTNNGRADMVVVRRDGQVVGSYPLSEERLDRITFGENEYNLLQISGGSVSIISADCPDQICVNHKPISGKGESIICLPHKLVVEITSRESVAEERGEPDAITY